MHNILSKSTFMYGCQCTKRLYLNKYHKNLANLEEEQQSFLFQKGTEAGELARELFPGGANAQGNEEWHSKKTVDVTSKLLPVHNIIYEAAFMFEGVLCAVDILVRKGKKYYAYEVKSSNSVKAQYETDAALQYYVLHNCGLEIADFSIIHFDNSYVRIGNLEIEKLFTATSILQSVKKQQREIAANVKRFKKIIENKQMPEIEMGNQCSAPYPCNFTNYCLSTMPPEPIEPEVAIDETIELDQDKVRKFMSELSYPIYFFDFETINHAIPQFDYTTAYQHVPFQYSLHVKRSAKARLIHTAYIGDGVNDPRPGLVKQLIHDMGKSGSILVWNRPFEKSCLQKLAMAFPQYKAEINGIIDRLVDLMTPFKSKMIRSEAFYNSASIKKVLPVLIPELSYSNLDIQEGGMASYTYGQLGEMDKKTKSKTINQLLEYCHLDTLAMVKIWEWIRKEM